jgi:hypothetical protein
MGLDRTARSFTRIGDQSLNDAWIETLQLTLPRQHPLLLIP